MNSVQKWGLLAIAAIVASTTATIVAAPANASPTAVTSTTLTATASSTTTGKTVTLIATVSVLSAVGTVQFYEGSTDIGSPLAVSSGTASITTGALAAGIHSFGAKFEPTDLSAFTASTGNAIVTVANPPPDRSSLRISRGVRVVYGKPTIVRGALRDSTTHVAISGAIVVLYFRHTTNKRFVKLMSAKSSSTGTVAYAIKPTSKTYYRWRYAATGAHAAAASAVQKIAVKQTVSIAATSARITHAHTLRVWGKVGPGLSGLRVTLQHLVGKRVYNGGAVVTKRQKLPNGKVAVGYVFTLKLNEVGSYRYRVSRAGSTALLAAVSRTIKLKAV